MLDEFDKHDLLGPAGCGFIHWGKGGGEDNIDVVLGKILSLREVLEFLNINRRVIREGPKVLFSLGKILK